MTITQKSAPTVLESSSGECPPLRISKHDFGSSQRIAVTQGGQGVSFLTTDLDKLIVALLEASL